MLTTLRLQIICASRINLSTDPSETFIKTVFRPLRALYGSFRLLRTSSYKCSFHPKKDSLRHSLRSRTSAVIQVSKTYELTDGGFIKLHKLTRIGGNLTAIGRMFRRVSETKGLLRSNQGEFYWVCHLVEKDSRPAEEQVMWGVGLSRIKRERTLRLVRQSPHEDCEKQRTGHRKSAHNGDRVCRWKQIFTAKTSKRTRPADAFSLLAELVGKVILLPLSPRDCDDQPGTEHDKNLRQTWCSHTERGGASWYQMSSQSNDDDGLRLAMERLSVRKGSGSDYLPSTLSKVQSYTFADVSCGCFLGSKTCWPSYFLGTRS